MCAVVFLPLFSTNIKAFKFFFFLFQLLVAIGEEAIGGFSGVDTFEGNN